MAKHTHCCTINNRIWHLAILKLTTASATLAPLVKVLTSTSESLLSLSHATVLTLLCLSMNALSMSLSQSLLAADSKARVALMSMLVQMLLHSDCLVWVAAANLAFNVGAWVQKGQVARANGGEDTGTDGIWAVEEDGEWEVELVSTVMEVLANKEDSEDAGEFFLSACTYHDSDHQERL